MEITVKVVLSADPELMTTLATLVECVQDVLHVSNAQLAAETSTAEPQPVVQTTADVRPVAPAVAPNTPAAAPAAVPVVPTAPAKTYTLEDLLTAAGPLLDQGLFTQLSNITKSYGVASFNEIPADKYGAVAADLRALGANL